MCETVVLSLVRQAISDATQARRLAVLLIAAFTFAVLAVGCAGNDDAEPTGRIVLFGSPEVGLIPAAGGKVERVRIGDAFSDVAFSPDGSQVAFNTDPDGITLMTLNDGRTTVVPDQPPQDRFLSVDIDWSPDGRSLAFVQGETILTISIDGSELREVARGLFPSWTPNSEQIVFVYGRDLSNAAVANIGVIGADGTGLRFLGRGFFPDVSPSGEEVAYSTPAGVFVRPLAGGAPRLVVLNGFGPVWSPDGKFLAFARYTDCSGGHGPCSGRIFIVPVEGGEPRAIGPTMGDPPGPEDWIR